MNGRLGLLGGILLAQLVIIGIMLFSGARDQDAAEKLLNFDPAKVDRVVIADQAERIELTRKADGWLVGTAPADTAKADKLINDFAGFASPWPVATTTTSAERFEVTEEKFQRRITFHAGEDLLGDVLLGTSPGFQRVHARTAGSEAVYSIAFSNFQAPTKADDWLDKALLAADGAVKSLTTPAGFKIEMGEEGWLLDGEAADQDAATTFVERFENLRVVGQAESDASGEDKGTFTVVDGKGEFTLRLSQGVESNEYLVRSSRREGVYRMAAYVAEQMLEGRDALLPKTAAAEDTSPATAPVESAEAGETGKKD